MPVVGESASQPDMATSFLADKYKRQAPLTSLAQHGLVNIRHGHLHLLVMMRLPQLFRFLHLLWLWLHPHHRRLQQQHLRNHSLIAYYIYGWAHNHHTYEYVYVRTGERTSFVSKAFSTNQRWLIDSECYVLVSTNLYSLVVQLFLYTSRLYNYHFFFLFSKFSPTNQM